MADPFRVSILLIHNGLPMRTLFSRQLGSELRIAEKTLLAFFAALFIASFTLSLPGATLTALAVLNVIVGCLVVALSKDDLVERSRIASPIRDWLPALLMLLAYRESGLFIKPGPAHRLDHLFIVGPNDASQPGG